VESLRSPSEVHWLLWGTKPGIQPPEDAAAVCQEIQLSDDDEGKAAVKKKLLHSPLQMERRPTKSLRKRQKRMREKVV
jgi:hypothetical protein